MEFAKEQSFSDTKFMMAAFNVIKSFQSPKQETPRSPCVSQRHLGVVFIQKNPGAGPIA